MTTQDLTCHLGDCPCIGTHVVAALLHRRYSYLTPRPASPQVSNRGSVSVEALPDRHISHGHGHETDGSLTEMCRLYKYGQYGVKGKRKPDVKRINILHGIIYAHWTVFAMAHIRSAFGASQKALFDPRFQTAKERNEWQTRYCHSSNGEQTTLDSGILWP